MKKLLCLALITFLLFPVSLFAATSITATTFVHFNTTTGNVTPAKMNASTSGTNHGWHTYRDSINAVGLDEELPYTTISADAAINLPHPVTINGIQYSNVSPNGIEFLLTGQRVGLCTDNKCDTVFFDIASPGVHFSVAFGFRYIGPNQNSSPRDIHSMTAPDGSFRVWQFDDDLTGAPNTHAHNQPGDSTGTKLYLNRKAAWGKRYHGTYKFVNGGEQMVLNLYDPDLDPVQYILIGQSICNVTGTSTYGATRARLGNLQYGANDYFGTTQKLRIGYLLYNADGTWPLVPVILRSASVTVASGGSATVASGGSASF